jgi:hypothetical protein
VQRAMSDNGACYRSTIHLAGSGDASRA